MAFYKSNESVGIVNGILLFLLFAVLFPPYVICYVSVLYIASGGDVVPAPAGGGLPGIPPAPPAPPAFGTPPAPTVGGQASGGYGGATGVPRYGGDDAWKAAADPLRVRRSRLRRSRLRFHSRTFRTRGRRCFGADRRDGCRRAFRAGTSRATGAARTDGLSRKFLSGVTIRGRSPHAGMPAAAACRQS